MLLWIVISSVHIFTVLSNSIPGYNVPTFDFFKDSYSLVYFEFNI